MIGDVEEREADKDAENGGDKRIAPEEVDSYRDEQVPDAAPDEHEPQDDHKVLLDIAKHVRAVFFVHMPTL